MGPMQPCHLGKDKIKIYKQWGDWIQDAEIKMTFLKQQKGSIRSCAEAELSLRPWPSQGCRGPSYFKGVTWRQGSIIPRQIRKMKIRKRGKYSDRSTHKDNKGDRSRNCTYKYEDGRCPADRRKCNVCGADGPFLKIYTLFWEQQL